VEKLISQSKRTVSPPYFQNFLIFQISISAFATNLLTSKRRKPIYAIGENLFRGSLFSQRKSIWKGENLSNLKNNFEKKYSYTLGQLQMNLKRFYQNICKNKLSGANVVQILTMLKTFICTRTPFTSVTYAHLSKLQTNYIFALYIWFDIVLASITKNEEIERKMAFTIFSNWFWCLMTITTIMY
jgi:hypothetical protein